MTKLLEKAMQQAAELPEGEQDAFALLMLDGLHSEGEWNKRFHAKADKLASGAAKALGEFNTGRTKKLNPTTL